jgi:hypothetical protein
VYFGCYSGREAQYCGVTAGGGGEAQYGAVTAGGGSVLCCSPQTRSECLALVVMHASAPTSIGRKCPGLTLENMIWEAILFLF